MDTSIRVRECPKVSLLGVDALWGDCTLILADWGSKQQICAIICSPILRLFNIRMIKSVKVVAFSF